MRGFTMISIAALGLAACGGNDAATNNDMNAMTADNMMVDQNAAMTGPGGMDGNVETNATTENMMMNDLTTNDADTNLANGM